MYATVKRYCFGICGLASEREEEEEAGTQWEGDQEMRCCDPQVA